MKNMKRWGLAAVAAVAVMTAGAIGAQAQTATPPAPSAAPQTQPARPGRSAGQGQFGGPKGGRGMQVGEAVTVSGTINEYTVNRQGDYDGFSLADGTLVRVPPNDAVKVKEMFAVGSSVQVKGNAHTDPNGQKDVFASEISSGAKSYTVQQPTERPAPPTSETVAKTAAITKLSSDPNGNLDGFYLGEQILVNLPHMQDAALVAKLTVGTQVEVSGDAHTGTSGLTVIRPQTIKIGSETVFTAPQGGPHGGPHGGHGRGGHGPRGGGPIGAPPANAPAPSDGTVTQ